MDEIVGKMGPHDLGGEPGSKIDTVDQGMTHWEKHANALRMTLSGKDLITVDETRRAAEDMGDHYFEIDYFRRQTEALAIVLLERKLIVQGALDQRMEEVKNRFAVPIVPLPDSHDHDGKPIQEDESGEGPNLHHVMNISMQELLQEKGLVTAEEIRNKIEIFDGDYPNRGPKVVARAWKDSKFRESLLKDANPVIEEMGIDLEHAARVIVVENTPEVHNIVVCTLCSCYPRVLMGQPPTWYKSRSYRSRVVYEPRAVLREFGTEIPESVIVRTHDSNADMRYMVLPMQPEGTEDWSEEQLEKLVSRDCLVGVSVPEGVI